MMSMVQSTLKLQIFMKEQQGTKQVARISAPGKIILCGEHAAVYGKDALAMAINLRCTATISLLLEKVEAPTLNVQFSDSSMHNIELNTQLNEEEDFPKYFQSRKQVGEELAKLQFKTALFSKKTGRKFPSTAGYSIYLSSEVPMGKCLGSSAAFNTVFAACLFFIAGDTEESILQNLEDLNKMSMAFEAVEHGTPSGIDNFVSTFGGMVLFNNSKTPSFYRIKDQQVMKKLTEDLQILLVDSGKLKNTKKAVGIVRKNIQADAKYLEMIEEIGTFSSKILELLSQNQNKEIATTHWKQELLKLLSINHRYLHQLGVSTPQIEQIVEKLNIPGQRTAKVTGAGMGGYVLVIADPSSPKIQESFSILRTKVDPAGLIVHQL